MAVALATVVPDVRTRTTTTPEMDQFRQDVRYAVRSLLQRPGFTIAALVTLALGIGATTAIFSVVRAVLLRPLPYAEPDRLVVLGQALLTADATGLGSMSVANFADLQQETRSFETMALQTRAMVTITGMGDAEVVMGTQVTPDFFRVFGAVPVMGRTFNAEEGDPAGPQAIIVSHQFWQERLGGAPDVLERTIEVSGTARPIVGVTPAGFEFPRGARVYVPVRNSAGCGRGCVYLTGVAKLAPGVTLAAAQTELTGVMRRLEEQYPEANRDVTARARLLTDVTVGDVRRALWVMLGAVFMVLLIACANVANLLLVRGATRGPELAVRAVLGAGRRRLLTQLMTENVLLALIGGALGVVLALWGVELLRRIAPAELPRVDELSLDGTAILFTTALVLTATLIFGLMPAIRMTRNTLATTLRGTGRGDLGIRQGYGRFAILVSEVALAVMLLLSAGLMMRSLARMNNVDTGLRTDDIAHFTVGLPSSRYETPEQQLIFHDELRRRLEALPGARGVGVVMPLPLGPSVYATSFTRRDLPPPEAGRDPTALLRLADRNGLDVLGISLSAGRLFEPGDRHGSVPVALINRTAAERFWPGADPVGRTIEVSVSFGYDAEEWTIVGVVEDSRVISLQEEAAPEIILPFAQSVASSATFVVATSDPGRLLSAARAEVRGLDANLPQIRPGTMAELIGAQTATTRFYMTLLAVFAALAVTLAAVGIYGVVAFVVARRSREIGVRMALGARIRQVVGLVVWQGIAPALVGLAVGVAGAFAGGRIIAGLLFDVQPHDPLTFAGVTLLLLAVVALACVVPASRAGRIPPASALRAD